MTGLVWVCLSSVVPRLFQLAFNKLSSAKDYYVGEGGFISLVVHFESPSSVKGVHI